MRRTLRAIRPAGGEVASCNAHLAVAMELVTHPTNGDDNDTHVVVRRLGHDHEVVCVLTGKAAAHRAAWVLIPQAVLR